MRLLNHLFNLPVANWVSLSLIQNAAVSCPFVTWQPLRWQHSVFVVFGCFLFGVTMTAEVDIVMVGKHHNSDFSTSCTNHIIGSLDDHIPMDEGNIVYLLHHYWLQLLGFDPVQHLPTPISLLMGRYRYILSKLLRVIIKLCVTISSDILAINTTLMLETCCW